MQSKSMKKSSNVNDDSKIERSNYCENKFIVLMRLNSKLSLPWQLKCLSLFTLHHSFLHTNARTLNWCWVNKDHLSLEFNKIQNEMRSSAWQFPADILELKSIQTHWETGKWQKVRWLDGNWTVSEIIIIRSKKLMLSRSINYKNV